MSCLSDIEGQSDGDKPLVLHQFTRNVQIEDVKTGKMVDVSTSGIVFSTKRLLLYYKNLVRSLKDKPRYFAPTVFADGTYRLVNAQPTMKRVAFSLIMMLTSGRRPRARSSSARRPTPRPWKSRACSRRARRPPVHRRRAPGSRRNLRGVIDSLRRARARRRAHARPAPGAPPTRLRP